LKGHAVVVDLVDVTQAPHLETAAVGQDRPPPPHKGVQAAQLPDQLVAGTQIKVIGVSQDQRRTQVGQIARRDGLDRRLGPYRAKDRCPDGAVGSVKHPGAGRAVGGFQLKGERLWRHSAAL
jgi:hypothetical protein